MSILKLFSLALLNSVALLGISGQIMRSDNSVINGGGTKTNPQRGNVIDLADVAKIKIDLAKKTYHQEEVMRLNLGVLITSSEDIYFPEKLRFDIRIVDSNGKRLKFGLIYLTNPLVRETGVKFKTVKEEFVIDFRNIIIGCNSKSIQDYGKRLQTVENLNLEKPKDAFELGLFPPVASDCINVKSGEKVSIQADLINDQVASDDKALKTAIGRIKSNTIQFTVK